MAPLNAGLSRRHFLRVLGAPAVAVALAGVSTPAPPWRLAFDSKAFATVARGLGEPVPSRYGMVYGWATVSPSDVVRLLP